MVRNFLRIAFLSLALFGLSKQANAQLTINLDFSSFNSGAPTDGGTILGGATLSEAQGVIEAAATYWENVFVDSSSSIAWSTNIGGNLVQDIDVTWGALGGQTLATGGTGWFTSDGRWAGNATLTWDNDGTSEFYVDSNPQDSLEWGQSSERDLNFNGVDVNVERVHYDAPAGVIRDNTDMFTVAVHEIGHALGFLGSQFPAFGDADIGNDGDVDITSGFLSGAQIGYSGGHTSFEIQSPGNGDFPYDPDNGTFGSFNYGPNVMSPSILSGVRKDLTEADIVMVAEFLEFDMNTVNFNPMVAAIPEPGTAFALTLLAMAGLSRRRRN